MLGKYLKVEVQFSIVAFNFERQTEVHVLVSFQKITYKCAD